MSIFRTIHRSKCVNLALLLVMLLPALGYAETQLPLITVASTGDRQDYSVNIQILLLLTTLSLLPGLLMVTTSFTRVLIVLAILRQALGLQQIPPTRVLIAVALILTAFIMKPVFDDIWQTSIAPYLEEQITFRKASEKAILPLQQFMLRHTRKDDLEQFVILSREQASGKVAQPQAVVPEEVPLTTLIPAFLSSEIKTAMQMGFMIFLPFLVIDLLVASLLMALGMIMLSPLIISLPLKLLLFILVDGWGMIMAGTVRSFSL